FLRSGEAQRRACGRQPAAGPGWSAPEPRALTTVQPVTRVETSFVVHWRPLAPFLAQLIATSRQLPQTRERRRAEPEKALAAYAATGVPTIRGRVVADL